MPRRDRDQSAALRAALAAPRSTNTPFRSRNSFATTPRSVWTSAPTSPASTGSIPKLTEKVKVKEAGRRRGNRSRRNPGRPPSRAVWKPSITSIPWRRNMARSILRLRTANRTDQTRVSFAHPGLAQRGIPGARNLRPLWHHLRRPSRSAPTLMWDEFPDHPMRKDYVEPGRLRYEPDAHDEVRGEASRAPSDRRVTVADLSSRPKPPS